MNIDNFEILPLCDTKFVHPVRLTYTQNGKEKSWEAVKSHDSVAVLLYHEKKDSFILVKQFRPPVYLNDRSMAYTYELCAGIIDKDKDIKTIAKEEIDEECGFDVPLGCIYKITSFFTNVGVSGAKQYLYFAAVNDDMKKHEGGGIHDEEIELVYLPVEEAKEFVFNENIAKTPGLMFAFEWFFSNKL